MFGQEAKLAALINRDPPQIPNEVELISELRAKLGPGAAPDKLLFQIRSARGKTHWAVNSYLRDVMSSSAPGQEDFRPIRPARAAAAAAGAAAAAAAAAAATASPPTAGAGAAAAAIAAPAVPVAASAPRLQRAEACSSGCSVNSQGKLGFDGGAVVECPCAAGQKGSPSMTPFQMSEPAVAIAAAAPAAGASDPAAPAVRVLGSGAGGGDGLVTPASASSVGRGFETMCGEPCAPAEEGAGKEQRSASVGEAPGAALGACTSCCIDSAADGPGCSHLAVGADGRQRSPPQSPAGSLPNVPPAAAAPAVPAPLCSDDAVGGDGRLSTGKCGFGGGADGGGSGGVGTIVVVGLGSGSGGGSGVGGPSMDSLPVSLLEAVFRYLDYRSLSSAAIACKAMSVAAFSESLWCGLYCARWGSLVFPTEPHVGAVMGPTAAAAAAEGGAAGGGALAAAAIATAAAVPQTQAPVTYPYGADVVASAGSGDESGAAGARGAITGAADSGEGTGGAAPRPAISPGGQTPPRLQSRTEAEAALPAATGRAAPAAAAAAAAPIDGLRPPPLQSPLARLTLLGRSGQGRAPTGPGPGAAADRDAAADAAGMDVDVKVPLAVDPPRSRLSGPCGEEAATLGGLGPPPGEGLWAGTCHVGGANALTASAAVTAAAGAQDQAASGVLGAEKLRAAQAYGQSLATTATDGEGPVAPARRPGGAHNDGGSSGNEASQDGPACPATPASAAAGVDAPQPAPVTSAGDVSASRGPPAAPFPPPTWSPPPHGRYRCQYRSQMSFLTSLRCPRCGGGTIVPIVYGFPSPKLMEGMRARRLILGGDHLIENCHVWGCTRCGASYRHFPYDSCEVWVADLVRQQQQQPQRPSHLPHYTYEL